MFTKFKKDILYIKKKVIAKNRQDGEYKKKSKTWSEEAIAEAVVQRCSVKKAFLKISQNSQENTCARVSFLIKLKASAQQLY